MKQLNEENACNAFIQILKEINGVEYEIESSPDEHSGESSDVDYILISKDGRSHRIAVEHTTVTAFDKQIYYGYKSYDVVEQINFQCKKKLPKDRYYQLLIPPPLNNPLKRKRKKQFVEEMASWISVIARTLTIDQWASRVYNSHKVTLICGGSHPEMNGNVGRALTQPEKVEELTREQFRRAIKEKLPKIIKYKFKGMTTSLLLEDISGIFFATKKRRRDLTIIQRLFIRIFMDYVIIFMSNNHRMVVGNVWKEKWHWYPTIPSHRKFTISRLKDT